MNLKEVVSTTERRPKTDQEVADFLDKLKAGDLILTELMNKLGKNHALNSSIVYNFSFPDSFTYIKFEIEKLGFGGSKKSKLGAKRVLTLVGNGRPTEIFLGMREKRRERSAPIMRGLYTIEGWIASQNTPDNIIEFLENSELGRFENVRDFERSVDEKINLKPLEFSL